jgi:hypothetical protein
MSLREREEEKERKLKIQGGIDETVRREFHLHP